MQKLRFYLDPKPLTRSKEYTEFKMWGELSIIVLRNSEEIPLVKLRAYLDEFIDWYVKNNHVLFADVWYAKHPGESIAQAFERRSLKEAQINDDQPREKESAFTTGYYQTHSLDTPLYPNIRSTMLVGKNGDEGEISLAFYNPEINPQPMEPSGYNWYRPGKWAYTFDIDDFRTHVKAEMIRFINEWVRDVVPEGMKGRWTYFLMELEKL